MRLFSEEVTPTLTSSNLNIISVEDYNEIFFDVYELEINGKKYVAEKIDSYNGQPVVSIPVVKNNKEYTLPFVLNKGKFKVIYNENNLTYVRDIEELAPEEDITDVYVPTEVETIDEIFNEKRKSFKEEISKTYAEAKSYAEKLKREKIREASKVIEERKSKIDAEVNTIKQDLITDFVEVITVIKRDLTESQQEDIKRLDSHIKEAIDTIYDDLAESIEKKSENSYNTFAKNLNKLAEDTLATLVSNRFVDLTKSSQHDIQTSIEQLTEKTNDRIAQRLDEFNNSIINLERANVDLNANIQKSANKALSRIGNVKTSLETVISAEVKDIQSRITLAEKKITVFYNDKIQELNEKVDGLTNDNRQEYIRLINESRESLLQSISEIKYDVPNIVIERQGDTDVKLDLKKVKSELEKSISARFSNELMSLKRMMEMTSGGGGGVVNTGGGGSGGGSDLDDGGVINGDLTILGSVSAREYYTTSNTFTDYSQQAIFKNELVAGSNNTTTFPVRNNPSLSTVKFYVTFTGFLKKTVCEVFILVTGNECIGNVYSIIHANNAQPLMTDLNCSIVDGALQLNSVVTERCTCTITGVATYVAAFQQSLEFSTESGLSVFETEEGVGNIFTNE